MLDFVLRFADEAAAKADPLIGRFWLDNGTAVMPEQRYEWYGQVTPGAVVSLGGRVQDGWWIVVPGYDDDAELGAHPATKLVLRRDEPNWTVINARMPTDGLDISPTPGLAVGVAPA